MKADVKTKWLAALRSGIYKQGKLFLKVETETGVEHCCLGVLCEIYARETGQGQWRPTSGDPKVRALHVPLGDNAYTVPPVAVAVWAGLWNNNPDVLVEEAPMSLASWNDAGGTFEEIASAIEHQL